jgi:hypothetical protein
MNKRQIEVSIPSTPIRTKKSDEALYPLFWISEPLMRGKKARAML